MDTRTCKADATLHGPTSRGGVYEPVVIGDIVALELSRTVDAKGQVQVLWVHSSGSGEPPCRSARFRSTYILDPLEVAEYQKHNRGDSTDKDYLVGAARWEDRVDLALRGTQEQEFKIVVYLQS